MGFGSYINNVLVGFDQFANTLFGGHPDETISSRWGRGAAKNKPVDVVGSDVLNDIQPGHTKQAIADDKARAAKIVAIETAAETRPADASLYWN